MAAGVLLLTIRPCSLKTANVPPSAGHNAGLHLCRCSTCWPAAGSVARGRTRCHRPRVHCLAKACCCCRCLAAKLCLLLRHRQRTGAASCSTAGRWPGHTVWSCRRYVSLVFMESKFLPAMSTPLRRLTAAEPFCCSEIRTCRATCSVLLQTHWRCPQLDVWTFHRDCVWSKHATALAPLPQVPALVAALVLAVGVWRYGPRRRRPVYLLDFDCWQVDPKLKVSRQRFMEGSVASEVSLHRSRIIITSCFWKGQAEAYCAREMDPCEHTPRHLCRGGC